MTDLENKLQQMFDIVQNSQIKLRKLNESLRSLFGRLTQINIQYKRKMPITDISFEEDFCKVIEDLRSLSDENYNFWGEIRNQYYDKYEKELKEEHRFLVKKISLSAIDFTRQTDELFTLYKNLHILSKNLPLRLNWWLFESCNQDLFKTTNRILFLMRSMEKRYV